MSNKEKKHLQLGMNPSTANGRLVRDTLWRLIEQSGQISCYRCNQPMDRESFSIEHKEAWLDSANPQALFFDQSNISFSHLNCNIGDGRRRDKVRVCGTATNYTYGCRCEPCVTAKSNLKKEAYTPESRREKYLKTGQ